MTYDECYEWLCRKRERAVDPCLEKMVQRLVDSGRARWFGKRKIASCYAGGRSKRWARAII